MRKVLVGSLVVVIGTFFVAASASRADDYELAPGHAGVTFKIGHAGVAWTFGRFNDVTGVMRVDADPAKSAFVINVKSDSIDTGLPKRDDHLRSPDFFNTKQFPLITFKSTSVKQIKDGYEVTGDLTMLGKTKSVTVPLMGGKVTQFPPNSGRVLTGFSTEFAVKRSEFGMDKMVGPVGDDVYLSISFEGVKK